MAETVISQRTQDSFVYLLISDSKFLQMARKGINPSYFSSQITEDIVNLCYRYYDQFRQAPETHLLDELVRFLKSKSEDEKNLYIDYLKRVEKLEIHNRAYVVRRVSEFIKAREFESSAIEFVKLVEEGKFKEGERLMLKALRMGLPEETIGLKYFARSLPGYYGSATKIQEIMVPTGFSIIDERIRGLRRSQLVCILGPFKGGKSWMCNHIAKEALMKGLRVLHISHEMTEDEVEMRYDMMLGGLTSGASREEVTFEDINERGFVTRTWSEQVETVFSPNDVKTIRKKMKKFGGELIIRKYPMGTCTMEEIDRYLDFLETYEGFLPDILINDYVEVMEMPLSKSFATRDRINQAYIDSKRIADQRNILVITVSQAVRGALNKTRLTLQDFAEDIRKAGNVDIAFGISRPDEASRVNRGTLYVIANRTGPQNFGCMFSSNLAVGQLCTNCWAIREVEQDNDE